MILNKDIRDLIARTGLGGGQVRRAGQRQPRDLLSRRPAATQHDRMEDRQRLRRQDRHHARAGV
jgi:hypothetical protein